MASAITPITPSLADYDAAGKTLGAHFSGAELYRLASLRASCREIGEKAKLIKDDAVRTRLDEVTRSGDLNEVERIATILLSGRIVKAIQAQDTDEERIRRLAITLSEMKSGVSEGIWRRKLRKQAKQAVSTINMTLGLVGDNSGNHHCTQFEKELRDEQKMRWMKFGESIEMERDGQRFKLADAMTKAGHRRASEIYALTKGLEKFAQAASKTWAFLTLTAPPNMHSNPSAGKNTWDGTLPDTAHAWIKDARERAEKRCRKAGIVISGVRVCEPHKDGCPHEHLMVFADPFDMAAIETEFRQQPEWRTKAGMKFVISDGRASAASYLFKYVLKTISSVEALEGERGTVDAWRSTWGIRAFSFFGMPPMGLWRNLRALESCPVEPLLAGLWRAAKRGDGAAFIGLAGGLNAKTKNRPVISRKESNPESDRKVLNFVINETGEAFSYPIKKWQRTTAFRANKAPKTGMVGVIPNYPRKSKAENQTTPILAPTTTLATGNRPPRTRPRRPISPIRSPHPDSDPAARQVTSQNPTFEVRAH